MTAEAIEHRIEALDEQDNDYFQAGSKKACAIAAANGFPVPKFDPDAYLPRPTVSVVITDIFNVQY